MSDGVISIEELRRRREDSKRLVWECQYGSQKYLICQDGPQCFECGRHMTWAEAVEVAGIELSPSSGGTENE